MLVRVGVARPPLSLYLPSRIAERTYVRTYAAAERADTLPLLYLYPSLPLSTLWIGNNNKLKIRIQIFYLEIELTLIKVEPESQLDDASGAHPAPEDVLNVGCKTLLKDPKQITRRQRENDLLREKENNANAGRQ
jgi:hypothetical protein